MKPPKSAKYHLQSAFLPQIKKWRKEVKVLAENRRSAFKKYREKFMRLKKRERGLFHRYAMEN